jgi:hypothetical protein
MQPGFRKKERGEAGTNLAVVLVRALLAGGRRVVLLDQRRYQLLPCTSMNTRDEQHRDTRGWTLRVPGVHANEQCRVDQQPGATTELPTQARARQAAPPQEKSTRARVDAAERGDDAKNEAVNGRTSCTASGEMYVNPS